MNRNRNQFMQRARALLICIVAISSLFSAERIACSQNSNSSQSSGASAGISSPRRVDRNEMGQAGDYLSARTKALQQDVVSEVNTKEDWLARRPELLRQLREMLGLDPLPVRTDLQATITGTEEADEVIVEKIHFQSLPGLYVTANFYRPKNSEKPLPTILYLCGHGAVKENGISYGNKVHYQRHGAWFASNGYNCLVVDSLQLGEIEGMHHGTYRFNRWDWLNRGYTPAGVEAWNCIRALDYLETREEVDASKFGVTGRSGGGAYSWWIAALDERIQCAVPVAGITDLENHVIDGCIEGHCDCMFFVNTYRWDYGVLAAMVAPRPLLISNTDRDPIFPLEGVVRVHAKTRKIYQLMGANEKVALQITAGEHVDTQELHIHAFRWFNHHLRGDDEMITKIAKPLFTKEQLRVFQTLPSDQRNTTIHDQFVSSARVPTLPESIEQLQVRRNAIQKMIYEKVVPEAIPEGVEAGELIVSRTGEKSAPGFVWMSKFDGSDFSAWADMKEGVDRESWISRQFQGRAIEVDALPNTALVSRLAIFAAQDKLSPEKEIQLARRYYLLGETQESVEINEIRLHLRGLSARGEARAENQLYGKGRGGIQLAIAILLENASGELVLEDPPGSHTEGPYLINIGRIVDVPELLGTLATTNKLTIHTSSPEKFSYLSELKNKMGDKLKPIAILPLERVK